ncbi:hypothetical protein [Streptomyces sp. TP-A0356]|uniref:hypothetical protein n=1 Tax=Streptomyces sp. TP-A0356 TaxID=1359208 RepID=UPI000AAA6C92|nr:hypothetical protein [Streptomyces sp. TP-A0356]
MTTPKTAGQGPATRSTKASHPASTAKASHPASTAKATQRPADTPAAQSPGKSPAASGGRTITITVPPLGDAVSKAVDLVALPVATARRVLPAKGGLLLYAGLGALAVAGALEWPLAVGVGIGYAVLRRNGPPAPTTSR